MLTLEDRIVAAIRQIIRAVDLHSRRLASDHGFTGPQCAVLQACQRLGMASPKTIAAAVHLSQATVTGILRRLEDRGLLARTPSDVDRRSVLIQVTDAGREVLQGTPSLLQDRFRTELAALKDYERMQILATLQQVAQLMGAEQIDASPFLTSGDIPSASESLHVAKVNREPPRQPADPAPPAE